MPFSNFFAYLRIFSEVIHISHPFGKEMANPKQVLRKLMQALLSLPTPCHLLAYTLVSPCEETTFSHILHRNQTIYDSPRTSNARPNGIFHHYMAYWR